MVCQYNSLKLRALFTLFCLSLTQDVVSGMWGTLVNSCSAVISNVYDSLAFNKFLGIVGITVGYLFYILKKRTKCRFNTGTILNKKTNLEEVEGIVEYGDTLLHRATRDGECRLIELLVMHDCNGLNDKNAYGNTPLHLAVKASKSGIIDRLFKSPDLDPNVEDLFGCAPIDKAIELNNQLIVQQLLAHPRINLSANSLQYIHWFSKQVNNSKLDTLLNSYLDRTFLTSDHQASLLIETLYQ